MITNWFTLNKLCIVLHDELKGNVIEKCLSFRKNELILLNADNTKPSLRINLFSPFQYILKTKIGEPRRHIKIFPELKNEIIEKIEISPDDRNIRIQFRSQSALIIVFRSQYGNIYFYQNDTVASFKKSKEDTHIEENYETLFGDSQLQNTNYELQIANDLRFNKFWKNSIHEIFSTKNDEHIYDSIERSNGQIWKGRYILLPNNENEQFVADQFYANYKNYIYSYMEHQKFSNLFKQLSKNIDTRLSYLQQSIVGVSNESKLQKRSEKMRFYADALNVLRGEKILNNEILIPEWFQKDGMPDKVPLFETKNLQQTIEIYYRKSSEISERIKQNKKRLILFNKELEKLKPAKPDLTKAESTEDLELFKKRFPELTQNNFHIDKKAEESRPYREFVSPSGILVWVGKSARQNDDLTFHYAHKKDLWLHTRHSKGSHVIMRTADRKHVDRKDIEFAAKLAARYSEEKHASLVSVIYTQKKYVSKIRNSGPGKVRFEYDKDILVKPETV